MKDLYSGNFWQNIWFETPLTVFFLPTFDITGFCWVFLVNISFEGPLLGDLR